MLFDNSFAVANTHIDVRTYNRVSGALLISNGSAYAIAPRDARTYL